MIGSIPTVVEVTLREYSFQQSTLVRIGAGEILLNVEYLAFPEKNLHSALDMLSMCYVNARAYLECISEIKKPTSYSRVNRRPSQKC